MDETDHDLQDGVPETSEVELRTSDAEAHSFAEVKTSNGAPPITDAEVIGSDGEWPAAARVDESGLPALSLKEGEQPPPVAVVLSICVLQPIHRLRSLVCEARRLIAHAC